MADEQPIRYIDAQPMPTTIEELRAFVQREVRKALQDVTRDMDMRPPRAYAPPRMETKALPAWAKHEETGTWNASGGIISSPALAIVGEPGPETTGGAH